MLGRGVFAAVADCASRGSIVGGDLAGRRMVARGVALGRRLVLTSEREREEKCMRRACLPFFTIQVAGL